MKPKFYQSTQDTAEYITSIIFDPATNHRWLQLFGQPQMGKTAIMLATAQTLYDQLRKLSSNDAAPYFAIITGMNDKEWPSQVNLDYLKYNCSFAGVSLKGNVFKNSALANKKKNGKLIQALSDPTREKYLFLDESHYAVKSNSSLKKLLVDELGLNFATDINEQLAAKRIRLLTVSATPFPEILRTEDITDTALPKIIYLEPDKAYYSMKCLQADGLLFDNGDGKDIFDEGGLSSTFKEALGKLVPGQTALIRSARLAKNYNRAEKQQLKNLAAAHLGCHVEIKICGSNGDWRSLSIQDKDRQVYHMEDDPVRSDTIRLVLVDQMLRVAIRVPMDYFSMLWDSSTDTLEVAVQSLAGRRMGFCSNKIPVYTNKQAIQNYIELIEFIKERHATYSGKKLLAEVQQKLKSVNTNAGTVSAKRQVNSVLFKAEGDFKGLLEVKKAALRKELKTIFGVSVDDFRVDLRNDAKNIARKKKGQGLGVEYENSWEKGVAYQHGRKTNVPGLSKDLRSCAAVLTPDCLYLAMPLPAEAVVNGYSWRKKDTYFSKS